jgi:hypothetical protein
MSEAIQTMPLPPAASQGIPFDLEPAALELIGASFAAAALLRAMVADEGIADSLSTTPALEWVGQRLSDAAENLAALHAGRAPRWQTCADLQDIASALAKATAAGEARRTNGAPGRV